MATAIKRPAGSLDREKTAELFIKVGLLLDEVTALKSLTKSLAKRLDALEQAATKKARA